MPLTLAQPVALYLLVAAALGTVLSAEVMRAPFILAIAVGVLGSLIVPAAHRTRLATSKLLGLLLVGLFVVLASQVLGGRVDIVVAATDFLVIVFISRLYTPRTPADATQLLTLSLLVVLAGSALNTSFSFAPYFLAYIVFSIWALTTTHLSKVSQGLAVNLSRLHISRRFLITTSVLALAIFTQTAAFFLIFPRMGIGYFRPQGRSAQAGTGFSDQVQLGGEGTLQRDTTVVLRVEFPRGLPPGSAEDLYFRGVTLSQFDGVRWSRATQGLIPLRPTADGAHLLGERVVSGAPSYVSYQEPTEKEYVFLIEPTAAIGFGSDYFLIPGKPRIRLFLDESRDVIAVRPAQLPVRLEAWLDGSREHAATAAARAAALALPEKVDPRLAEQALRWIGAATTSGQKANAIMRALGAGYRYTTDMVAPPAGIDPLAFFLFTRKRGHCEYFASALAALLRTQGVPARLVNGYRGASYNSYGDYWAVAEYRAHTWVEYFEDGQGWVRAEPTPPRTDEFLAAAGVFERVTALVDWARYRWNRYVLDYDLDAQVSAVRSIRDFFERRGPEASIDWRRLRETWGSRAALLVATVALTVLAVWAGRRRRFRGPPAQLATRLYRRFERQLSRRGLTPRAPGMGPADFAREVAGHEPAIGAIALTFTDHYLRARFGAAETGADAGGAALAGMRAQLKMLASIPLERRRSKE